jgi:hypothetical protein
MRSCPLRAAFIRAAKPHPCRPLTSGPASRRAGPPAIPLDWIAGDMRLRLAPWWAAFIRAAKLNPYRPHCRQSRIPAASPTSGPAGRRAGPPAITLDRNAGDGRPRSAPWRATFIRAANLHPCRSPHERACGRGNRRSPLDRNAGDERPRPGLPRYLAEFQPVAYLCPVQINVIFQRLPIESRYVL